MSKEPCDMTYKQFVAKMQEHEGRIGRDPNDDMKEVFRWASQYHFDHLWRYLICPELPLHGAVNEDDPNQRAHLEIAARFWIDKRA